MVYPGNGNDVGLVYSRERRSRQIFFYILHRQVANEPRTGGLYHYVVLKRLYKQHFIKEYFLQPVIALYEKEAALFTMLLAARSQFKIFLCLFNRLEKPFKRKGFYQVINNVQLKTS